VVEEALAGEGFGICSMSLVGLNERRGGGGKETYGQDRIARYGYCNLRLILP